MSIQQELRKYAHPDKIKIYQNFFKTGPGEYGEGDIFIGLTVPDTRAVAKKYLDLSLEEVKKILESKVHEDRLAGLLILVAKFDKFPEKRKELFEFYLKNTKHINNWDLVDLSAYQIIGRYIFQEGKENPLLASILIKLSKSKNLWEKRIAIVSTYYFIKNNRFDETSHIAEILLNDSHDLIHKAVGWMLREVGNRDLKTLEYFLKKHYKKMPRTMLRYAIEKFPEEKRQKYLKGEV
ncbi:DNA alkylation repair protein [Candidatus Pacearchaeota archaeon CG10_big_fil_rev_8_21_14_0_10_31_24]|nr:MAG: DNA alkylation repair protein [Candidatus Pacearchaeota archaeon CG10_big_fil_rev_8_21_14_0_10_31_24]